MRFNIGDYKGGYVMHCSTKEESDLFRQYLHNEGKTWSSGKSYLYNDYWEEYREQFCYRFNAGCYANIELYKEDFDDYTILEFSDFEWGNEPEIELDDEDDEIFDAFMRDWQEGKHEV